MDEKVWFGAISCGVLALLAIAAVRDVRTREVPIWATVPLLVLGAGRALLEREFLTLAAMALALFPGRRLWVLWALFVLMLVGAGWSLWRSEPRQAIPLVVIWMLYWMWYGGGIGGGDGQVAMALVTLFPSPLFLVLLAVGWLFWGVGWLVVRHRWEGIHRLVLALAGRRVSRSLEQDGIPGVGGTLFGFFAYVLSVLVGGVPWR